MAGGKVRANPEMFREPIEKISGVDKILTSGEERCNTMKKSKNNN